ncbi:MAG: hypothetical protein KTR25_04655 [Myxococcales bacterium]|nr:hypothetical protein [Myxococcales bacterium]
MTEGGRGRLWSFIGSVDRQRPVAKQPNQARVPKQTAISLDTNEGQLRQLYRMVGHLRTQVEERSAVIAKLEAANTHLENAVQQSLNVQDEQARRIAVMHKALRDAQEFNREQESELQRLLQEGRSEEVHRERDDEDELQAFIDGSQSNLPQHQLRHFLPLEPARLINGVWQEVGAALAQCSHEAQDRFRIALHSCIANLIPVGGTWSSHFCTLLAGLEVTQLVTQATWELNDTELIVRLEGSQVAAPALIDELGACWRSPWGLVIEACLVGTGQQQAKLVSVEQYEDHELLSFAGLVPPNDEELSGGISVTQDLKEGVLSPSSEADASAALLSGVILSQSHPLSSQNTDNEGLVGLGDGDCVNENLDRGDDQVEIGVDEDPYLVDADKDGSVVEELAQPVLADSESSLVEVLEQPVDAADTDAEPSVVEELEQLVDADHGSSLVEELAQLADADNESSVVEELEQLVDADNESSVVEELEQLVDADNESSVVQEREEPVDADNESSVVQEREEPVDADNESSVVQEREEPVDADNESSLVQESGKQVDAYEAARTTNEKE